MTKRQNPCYNCENRTALCRIDCPEWMEYVKKRDSEYARADRLAEIDYIGHVIDRVERCRKRTRKKNKL